MEPSSGPIKDQKMNMWEPLLSPFLPTNSLSEPYILNIPLTRLTTTSFCTEQTTGATRLGIKMKMVMKKERF